MVVREGRPLPGMSRRAKVTIAVVIGVIVLFSLLGTAVDLWTEVLWFQEVEYSQVFTGVLFTRVGLFLMMGLGMALLVGLNLWLAYRLRPLLRPHSPEQASLERYRAVLTPHIGLWIGVLAGTVGLFAGLTAQSRWDDWMMFRHGGEFGWKDPILGVDAGFYVFQYPFLRFLLGVGFAVVVLSLLGALVMHYLYGGVRLQGVGDRITTAARAHLSVLVALFVGLKAVAYWLDRRSLMLELNDEIGLYGAGASSVNALLPAKEMLIWISVMVAIAILVFANAVMRNLTYPAVALGLLAVAAIVIGGVYPWGVQTFDVRPTLRDKEAPYIQHSIEATRYAFALDGTEMTPVPGRNDTPPPQMAEDERLAASIRLLDPEILPQTYTQLQQVRGFYGFGEKLDVVRYDAGAGDAVDYVVGARQISDVDLTQQQQQWQNRHSYYSHGYGLVGAPASEVVCNGQPYFVSGFLGTPEEEGGPEQVGGERCRAPTDIPELAAEQPRIYYGDGMSDYVIVGGVDEFDRPSGGGEVTYRYTGKGGVEVGSFWRKLLYAIKFRESNFVLSEILNPESKVIYEREPRERVQKVAPFLTVDGDPYPAVVDGRIVWIVDAYTTAETFPYSQRIDLQTETQDAQVGAGVAQLAQEEISYMRNSVKATVDAYDGTVTLYEFDAEDPVLQAWNEAFGGDLVVPKEETPESLIPHFRYPIDMFKVQRNLLQRFYVEDPGEFFAGTDFWEVPNTPANPDSPFRQPPYYLLAQFPGQEEPTFQLTSALSPVDRLNLASLVSGAFVDGELRLQAWTLPDDTRIPGPVQVHQFMTNASAVRSELTLLEAGGSARVEFGNLLSLPYEDGMLYVEPVYVRTTATDAYPLLQKVLMSYGQYVTLADSVEEGLADLVEQGERGIPTLPDESQPQEGQDQQTPTPPPPTEPPAEPTPTPPATEEPPPDLAEAQEAMEAAERELEEAYDSGDFARIAQALQEWYEARQALKAAGG